MQWLATCDGDTFAVATAVLDVIVSLDDADREDRDAYETALLSHVAASRPELLALAAARYCREVQP
jgi:hypothetical protein